MSCDTPPVTTIPLGRASLPGSVLPTRRLVRSHTSRQEPKSPPTPTYLVLLRVEIARFTRRLPCGRHRLVSVALILTSRWTAVNCYAALCSPDLPPTPLESGTGGGLARFTHGLSASASAARYLPTDGPGREASLPGAGKMFGCGDMSTALARVNRSRVDAF